MERDAAAAYRVDANRWRLIPKTPIERRIHEVTVWSGDELLIWGGVPNERGARQYADGAAYDPELNRWSMLPRAPRGAEGPTRASGQPGPSRALAVAAAIAPPGAFDSLPIAPTAR